MSCDSFLTCSPMRRTCTGVISTSRFFVLSLSCSICWPGVCFGWEC
jgi:hypothetical protein